MDQLIQQLKKISLEIEGQAILCAIDTVPVMDNEGTAKLRAVQSAITRFINYIEE
jgi:hypothetical protein